MRLLYTNKIMETLLLKFYKQKIKPQWKIAFLSVFIIGFLIYGYKFSNPIINHDSLYNYYSDQNCTHSGRWFLSFASSFSSFFDLPWIIGIFSLLYIALTTAVIVDIFNVKSPVLTVLIGGILLSFPTVAATFNYGFTADGYMMAMLLAALSLRFCLLNEKRKSRYLLSALCLCLCCGIYQAYVSFAMVLCIIYFLYNIFENKYTNKDYLCWIVKQLAIYAVSMASYYMIWKLCLYFSGLSATSYKGIDQVGNIDIITVKVGIYNSVTKFISFFLDPEIIKTGFTAWSAFNLFFTLAAVITVIVVMIKSKLFSRKLQLLLSIIAFCAIPFSVYIWYFASPGVSYHMLMLQSLSLSYIFIALLIEHYFCVSIKQIAVLSLAVFIGLNATCANIFYYHLDKYNSQAHAIATEMATRIHLLDDGGIKFIAVTGTLDNGLGDNAFENNDELRPIKHMRSNFNNVLAADINLYMYLDHEIGFRLSYYDQNKNSSDVYFQSGHVPTGGNYHFGVLSKDKLDDIKETDDYIQMPYWPAQGSVKVFGDAVIIKLS